MSEKITSYCSEFNKKRKKMAVAGAALFGVGLSSFLYGCKSDGIKNEVPDSTFDADLTSSQSGASASSEAYSSMVGASNSEQRSDPSEQEQKKNYENLDKITDEEIRVPYNENEDVVAQSFIDRWDTMVHVGVNDSLSAEVKKDPAYISKLIKQTDERFAKVMSNDEKIENDLESLLGYYDFVHEANLYCKLEKKDQDLHIESRKLTKSWYDAAPAFMDPKYGKDIVVPGIVVAVEGTQEPNSTYSTVDSKGKDVVESLTPEAGVTGYNLIFKQNSQNNKLVDIEDLKVDSTFAAEYY